MTLSSKSAERILALYEAAKENGSLISVQEMLLRLPESASERELEETISGTPSLNSKLKLQSGYVTEKSGSRAPDVVLAEAKSRDRAKVNMWFASRFVPSLPRQSLLLVAVSGSTSYKSASKSKDLDLFCVARRGSLWVQLALLLLSARLFRLTNPGSPEICFSCMMDERYAERIFTDERSLLFARDALQAVVVRGDEYYADLLSKGNWISRVYPLLYGSRVSGRDRRLTWPGREPRGLEVLNRFMYITLGSYVKLKSRVRNRVFARQGRPEDEFDVRVGEDHLIYESRRYKHMKGSSGDANRKLEGVQIR